MEDLIQDMTLSNHELKEKFSEMKETIEKLNKKVERLENMVAELWKKLV